MRRVTPYCDRVSSPIDSDDTDTDGAVASSLGTRGMRGWGCGDAVASSPGGPHGQWCTERVMLVHHRHHCHLWPRTVTKTLDQLINPKSPPAKPPSVNCVGLWNCAHKVVSSIERAFWAQTASITLFSLPSLPWNSWHLPPRWQKHDKKNRNKTTHLMMTMSRVQSQQQCSSVRAMGA